MKNKFLLSLLFALAAIITWSAIKPFSRGVWYVEISSVLTVLLALVFTCRNFQFSNASYFIISLWLAMHAVGAHYSFELVPFDWVTNFFGFERNHYDRVAHFVIGLNAFGVAEYFFRRKFTTSIKSSAFVGILFIMALANAWELIEWAYAVVDGGEVGAAFLGSQGDVWDAQKDMLADTLGAIVGAFIFIFFAKKLLPKKSFE